MNQPIQDKGGCSGIALKHIEQIQWLLRWSNQLIVQHCQTNRVNDIVLLYDFYKNVDTERFSKTDLPQELINKIQAIAKQYRFHCDEYTRYFGKFKASQEIESFEADFQIRTFSPVLTSLFNEYQRFSDEHQKLDASYQQVKVEIRDLKTQIRKSASKTPLLVQLAQKEEQKTKIGHEMKQCVSQIFAIRQDFQNIFSFAMDNLHETASFTVRNLLSIIF